VELQQEADALKKSRYAGSIDRIAADKRKLVAKLEQFGIQLNRILSGENLLPDQQGLADYFLRAEAANLSAAEAKQNWAELVAACAESKLLNEQNGACLELLARHNKSALQILKGKPPFANTYGPDGAPLSTSHTHTLVLA
jgi:flagella synthesis protein FlgN